MDDDLRSMKLIQTASVDNNRNYSESAADVKLSPCHVKVCTHCIFYFIPGTSIK